MNKYFRIGEISKLYNIGVDSLRYYEDIGLIKPKRSESGYRLYSEQDIGRLNVIRDLRELGFNMDTIKLYMENQNVNSTLNLLNKELEAIDNKMKFLTELKNNVKTRMQNINLANKLDFDKIIVKDFDTRYCYAIDEGYTEEDEMNILIKELVNKSKDSLYIIGNNQIGTVVKFKDNNLVYDSVFLISNNGNHKIKSGKYLTVAYRGEYTKSKEWINKLIDYANKNGYVFDSDVMEILWIDIHTTNKISEYITELQVRIK